MSAETFYCTELREKLLRASVTQKPVNPTTSELLVFLAKKIDQAVKFRLPEDGNLLGDTGRGPIKALLEKGPGRLPFPCVALEYRPSGKSDGVATKMVLLAWEAGDKIVVWPIGYFPVIGDWVVSFGAHLQRVPDDGQWSVEPLMAGEFMEKHIKVMEKDPSYSSSDHFRLTVAYELRALASFMAAMGCSNVTTSEQRPPEKLARRRQMRGKQPLYSYHVLVINAGASPSAQPDAGGTHASPRVHLRRGHIRRLPSKSVWVNACVVGNKAAGIVVKDYEVRA